MTKQRIDYAGVVLSLDPEREERNQVRTQLQWDYSQVPALHRKAVEDAAVEIAVAGRQMQSSVAAIGAALVAAKGLLAHGQFEEWCRIEFGMSQRTAQNMMNVARTFDGKSEKISLLSDSTLYLLAAPSTPATVREAVIEQAESTGRAPSVAEVKAAVRLHTYGLESIVSRWIVDVWQQNNVELPDNASHSNGPFWQQLTAWMHANVREVWAENQLKLAIQNVIRQLRQERRADEVAAARVAQQQAAPQQAAQQVPPLTTNTLADWLRPILAGCDAAQLRHDARTLDGEIWRRCVAALRESPYRNGFHWTPALLREALRLLAEELGEPETQPDAEPITETMDEYLDYRSEADANGNAYLSRRDWIKWTEAGRPTVTAELLDQEAPAPADDRHARLQRWWARLMSLQNDLLDWGNLTGRHLATGEVDRGLRKMMEITQREIDLLEGREVELLELEREGWG